MTHRLVVVLSVVLALAGGCANQPPASPSSVTPVAASSPIAVAASSGSDVVRATAEDGGGVSASCIGPLAEWYLEAADGSSMGGTCCPAFDASGNLLRADFCDIFASTGRFAGAQSFQTINSENEIETFRFLADGTAGIDIVAQYRLVSQEFTATGTTSIRKERVTGRCKLPGADETTGRGHRWTFEPTPITHMGQTKGSLAFCPPL